jgi:hypothetical protein
MPELRIRMLRADGSTLGASAGGIWAGTLPVARGTSATPFEYRESDQSWHASISAGPQQLTFGVQGFPTRDFSAAIEANGNISNLTSFIYLKRATGASVNDYTYFVSALRGDGYTQTDTVPTADNAATRAIDFILAKKDAGGNVAVLEPNFWAAQTGPSSPATRAAILDPSIRWNPIRPQGQLIAANGTSLDLLSSTAVALSDSGTLYLLVFSRYDRLTTDPNRAVPTGRIQPLRRTATPPTRSATDDVGPGYSLEWIVRGGYASLEEGSPKLASVAVWVPSTAFAAAAPVDYHLFFRPALSGTNPVYSAEVLRAINAYFLANRFRDQAGAPIPPFPLACHRDDLHDTDIFHTNANDNDARHWPRNKRFLYALTNVPRPFVTIYPIGIGGNDMFATTPDSALDLVMEVDQWLRLKFGQVDRIVEDRSRRIGRLAISGFSLGFLHPATIMSHPGFRRSNLWRALTDVYDFDGEFLENADPHRRDDRAYRDERAAGYQSRIAALYRWWVDGRAAGLARHLKIYTRKADVLTTRYLARGEASIVTTGTGTSQWHMLDHRPSPTATIFGITGDDDRWFDAIRGSLGSRFSAIIGSNARSPFPLTHGSFCGTLHESNFTYSNFVHEAIAALGFAHMANTV